MNRFTLLLLTAALVLATIIAPANANTGAVEVAPQVRDALAWTLPANDCQKPKAPGQRKAIFDSDGISREEWDVDHYTLKRYKRKEGRWQKCVDDYKNSLKAEFNTLKDSARFGLTRAQADVILGKMKVIQTVIESAEGLPPE